MKNNHYFNITELARRANVNPLTIAFKVATNQIKADRTRSRIRISHNEGLKFIQKVKVERQGQTYLAYS
jgi:hypothetical protein